MEGTAPPGWNTPNPSAIRSTTASPPAAARAELPRRCSHVFHPFPAAPLPALRVLPGLGVAGVPVAPSPGSLRWCYGPVQPPRLWVFNSNKAAPPAWVIYRRDGAAAVFPPAPHAPREGQMERGGREFVESERFIQSSRCTKSGDGGAGSAGNAVSPRPPLPAHFHFLALVLKGRLHQ